MFLSSVRHFFLLCFSHLFCRRCCLPLCQLNWSDRLTPDHLDWPPGSPGTSAAPGMWWTVWHTLGGWWRRLEIRLKKKIKVFAQTGWKAGTDTDLMSCFYWLKVMKPEESASISLKSLAMFMSDTPRAERSRAVNSSLVMRSSLSVSNSCRREERWEFGQGGWMSSEKSCSRAGLNQLGQKGEKKNTAPFTHLRKTSGLFFPKPYLSLEPQKDSQNRCALFKFDLFMNTNTAVLQACCLPVSAKDNTRRLLKFSLEMKLNFKSIRRAQTSVKQNISQHIGL